MAIDFPGLPSAQTAGNRGKVNDQQATDKAPRTDATTMTQGKRPDSGDTVRISDAAQALQRSGSVEAGSDSAVDNERVAQIKAAIDNGSYRIDNERVAERMLQFDNLLS
ncbi:flagellar biosynthesis anti-sigma factor FlgM [Marinobacterium weihaiense]|uniref:Anti-sigma-28 factor n=1 Tax=Marinobacterium weihaiense TaxID=2851016 RepID=A0ABS6MD30_9GAMM|nr:flagellar biosynthesis anti-sigma factor FlgM [Marinobacterium weihaiense]MBV0934065.1 flagellar biosynthesis anti-sigma factor FlgM [Marinobacterium weihaiense]